MVTVLLLLLLLFPVSAGAGTVLGDAAAALSPGQWTQVSGMTNLAGTAVEPAWQNGTNGPFYDGPQPGWNSIKKKLVFIFAEHGLGTPGSCSTNTGVDAGNFPNHPHTCWTGLIRFDDATNTWTTGGPYPFQAANGFPVNGVHTYGHIAWDDVNEVMYVRQWDLDGSNNVNVFRYCTNATLSYCATQGANTWKQVASLNLSPYGGQGCCEAIAWHPTLNGGTLLYFAAQSSPGGCAALFGFRETGGNGTWSVVDAGTGCKFPSPNSLGYYMVPSTPKGLVMFGGGVNGGIWWSINEAGTITRLDNHPNGCSLGTTNGTSSQGAADPVTGDAIFVGCTNAGQLWRLNPTASSGSQWTLLQSTLNATGEICNVNLTAPEPCGGDMYVTSISTYGVIGFWKFRRSAPNFAEYWIYKPLGGSSVLGGLADSMSADSWAVLPTPTSCNTTNTLLETGGNIILDASQGAYDPVLQQVHIIGKGSTGSVRHVVYNVATNTCALRTTPPWSQTDGHSYEYGPTIDARGRILYRGRAGSLAIERYNLDTQTWLTAVTPDAGVAANTTGFQANAFHYERGAAGQLILAGLESGGNGVLYEYDPILNTFARLNGGALLSGFVDFSVAEYSEVHKVTLFGGRAGTYRQVDTRGTISTISTSGMGCQPYFNRDGILHADPVTGNFVLLCGSGASSWQIYDPVEDTWTAKTTPSSVTNHILQVTSPSGFGQTYGKIGVPLTNHGVILYIACNAGTDCQMRLYKGGTFTTVARDFKQRCYAANVILCVGFDSVNETTGTVDVFSPYTKLQGLSTGVTGAYGDPELDCTIKLGNCALKLTTGANSGANAGGSFTFPFRDDGSKTFGKDDEFYVQWRQRWTACLLYTGNTEAECTANGLANNWTNRRLYGLLGGSGGWKIMTINEGGRADHTSVSTHGEITWVIQDNDQKGMMQWYSYTGEGGGGVLVGSSSNMNTGLGGYEIQWNNGEDGINCPYPGPYIEPGCVRWRPDQWVTMQLHVKPNGQWDAGAYVEFPHGPGTFEMWFAQDGLTSKRVVRRDPALSTGTPYGNGNPSEARFGQITLENYHTNKNPAQTNPVAYTWFDEFIISTTRIADPGAVSSTPPISPSSVKLTRRIQ